jgi:hypothetical protein
VVENNLCAGAAILKQPWRGAAAATETGAKEDDVRAAAVRMQRAATEAMAVDDAIRTLGKRIGGTAVGCVGFSTCYAREGKVRRRRRLLTMLR